MKMLKKICFVVLVGLLLTGCGGRELVRIYDEPQVLKPSTILLSFTSKQTDWNEDWRMAFEDLGYRVVLDDEVRLSKRTWKSKTLDVERVNIIEDDDLHIEFSINYFGRAAWIESATLRVRNLHTGRTMGSYRLKCVWCHPYVPDVVNDIDNKLLSTFWK